MTEQSFEAEASCFLRRISLYEINEFLHVRGERGGVDQIFVSSQRSLEIRVLSNVGLNGFGILVLLSGGFLHINLSYLFLI